MGQVVNLFTREIVKPAKQMRYFKDDALNKLCLRFQDSTDLIEALIENTGLYGNEICPYIGNVQLWDKYDSGFSLPIPCNIDWLLESLPENEELILGNAKNNEPFMWMDRKYKQTLRILKQCKLNNNYLTITTASDLIVHDGYIDHLDKSWEIYIDLETEHNGMPSVKRRIRAFQKLFSLGFNVKPLDSYSRVC